MNRVFTRAQAEEILPVLKERLLELRKLKKAMESRAPAIVALADRGRENSGSAAGTAYLQELLAFRGRLEEFLGTGCLLRDLERGLLDFPSIRNNRKIFLCWAWGEPSIGWWHEADTGFAGRKPL